jgi:hypothetical protein
MKEGTTGNEEVLRFRQNVRETLRSKVREAIEATLEEELAAALGSEWYERGDGRRGYRNGSQARTVTTELGPRELRIPRGRIAQANGITTEFRSEVVPRYARRTRQIDEAILGIYLAGANSRRIRKALEPLLGEGMFQVTTRYGYMEEPDIPALLARVHSEHGIAIPPMDTTYFLGRETLIITARPSGMATWRERLFVSMMRNAQSAARFFRLPPNRVVELGAQIEF